MKAQAETNVNLLGVQKIRSKVVMENVKPMLLVSGGNIPRLFH